MEVTVVDVIWKLWFQLRFEYLPTIYPKSIKFLELELAHVIWTSIDCNTRVSNQSPSKDARALRTSVFLKDLYRIFTPKKITLPFLWLCNIIKWISNIKQFFFKCSFENENSLGKPLDPWQPYSKSMKLTPKIVAYLVFSSILHNTWQMHTFSCIYAQYQCT